MYNGGTKYQIGGERGEEMGKEKGQRVRKTNVRHMLYIKGLRQTPSIMVSYREQQFSLHVVFNSLLTTTVQLPAKTQFDFSLYSMTEFPEGCFYVG